MKILNLYHYCIVIFLLSITGCYADTKDEGTKRGYMTTSSNNTAISGLPHSQGASFNSLDSYLAHLRKMGQQDRPFYEEVSPNRYKLNTGRGSARRAVRYFTRDDLMQKFGFSQ